jgi:hypothetical protein
MTQNNPGAVLQERAIRTAGKESTELLAQAVAAHRSAFEVYTRSRERKGGFALKCARSRRETGAVPHTQYPALNFFWSR